MTRVASATERRVWLGFAVLVVVAAIIGWLIFANDARVRKDNEAVDRTNQTLTAIDAAFSSLQEVESGQRGYVITGNPLYLAQLNDAVRDVGLNLARLKPLLAGDPLQQERFTTLEALTNEKISFAGDSIAVRDTLGDDAADQFIASGRGKAVLDEARGTVRAMQETESEHLRLRHEDSDRTTRNSTILMLALGLFSLALFAGLLVALARSLASQRRAAEAASRLGAIVRASSDAIMSLDLEGNIDSWNAGAEHIFGYSADEAVGKHVSLIGPPGQAGEQTANLQAVREGGEIVAREAVRKAKDGSLVDVSVSLFRIQDASDNLTGFGVVVRDVTAHKRAEEVTRESERRWAAVFHASPAAIAISRIADAVILDVNQSWLDLFGFSRETVIGRTAVDLGIWTDALQRVDLMEHLSRKGSLQGVELQFRTSTGRLVDAIASSELLEVGGESCLVAVIVDITARVEADRDRERVFSLSSDPIAVAGFDGHLRRVNPAALDTFGYSEQELLSTPILDLFHPGDREIAAEAVAILARGDRRATVDGRIRAKDGRYLRVEIAASAEPGEQVLYAVVRDVTARWEMAEELRAGEERFRSVIETATDGIIITDSFGNIEVFNAAAERTFGYTAGEAVGQNVSILVPPPTNEDHSRFIAEFIARGTSEILGMRRELSGRRKDGSLFPHDLTVNAMRLGDEVKFAAIVRDTTARKLLETELRTSEERFRSVVETSHDAIVVIDSHGIIESFNRSAESMFEYSAAEAIGRNVSILMPSPYREAHDGYIARFVATGERRLAPNREVSGLRKDGTEFHIELTVSEVRVAGDLRFAGVIRDITARKQMAAELVAAVEAAEEANRGKSAFLSRMSHELRTPLNVVLGFAQVLQLDPLEPPQTEAVDYILKAGRHLLDLIDEVLDISRIEAGRLSLSLEPVQVIETVTDVLTLMRPLSDQRAIAIRADLDSCQWFVVADRQRLRQVLLNLVANAVKYNKEGGTVDIACAQVAGSGLRIMVTDTGPGIAPDKLSRLFVAFDRLGAEATDVEGTGLGLALSQRLVEAMGGTIGVESTVDVGSTFWVELALTEEPADPPGEDSSESAKRLHSDVPQRTVLYIEDNLANFSLMERILVGRLGFRLLSAMQGSLGLDLAIDHHPDLILLDLHLPDMPGNEVLDRLQANPATRDIPVVIITADASPGQVARLLDSGARAYITKPFDLKELFDVIESVDPGARR